MSEVFAVPQSLEAERSTLGAMMMERDAIARAVEIVSCDEFYRELHRKIFAVIIDLYNHDEPVDLITLARELKRRGELEEIGGVPYLNALIEACPSSANVESYAQAVHDTFLLRRLMAVGESIIRDVKSQEHDADEVMARIEKRIQDLSRKHVKAEAYTLAELAERQAERIIRTVENPDEQTGVITGFTDLDRNMNPMQPGELILIAGNTGMGKSTLASQIASHVLKATRRPVFVFSLEMNQDMWFDRMVCSEASINGRDLKKAILTREEWARLKDAEELFAGLLMVVVDTPGMTTAAIRAQCQRLANIHGDPVLIVVDYLQIANYDGKTESMRVKVSEMVKDFKNIARQMEAPLILLSQIVREVAKRDDKRPTINDLRESGAIESESDVILFAHRPSYYKRKMAGESAWQGDNHDEPDEIIIGKQRNGEAGVIVPVRFNAPYARFEDLAAQP